MSRDETSTLHTILDHFLLSPDARGTPIELKGVGRAYLPVLFRALGYTQGAEIGVWKGVFSEILCQGVPGLHLFCIDAWQGYANYRDHRHQHLLGAAYDTATARLTPYGATLIREFSVPAAAAFPDGSLDFVYIDANHSFEHVVADLAAWEPKVRSGGILSGHDYFEAPRHLHIWVVEAINGYTKAHDLDPWFLLGRRKVRPGEFHELERSWFWVKP